MPEKGLVASGSALFAPGVFDQISAAAVEGYRRFARGGIEIGGVLFGERDQDGVCIRAWRPIACEHADGPGFKLSPRDEAGVTKLLAAYRADPELAGLEPVGFFVSHTRTGLTLAPDDIALLERHFPKPWQKILLIEPRPGGVVSAKWFEKRPDGSFVGKEVSQHAAPEDLEATLKVRIVEQESAVPSFSRPLLHARPEPDASRETAEETKPPRRRGWLRTLITALGAIIVAVIAFDYIRVYLEPSPTPTIQLRAWDTQGQLRIEWDSDSALAQTAESGVLALNDGGAEKELPLRAEMLRRGSITYVRQSGDVQVRLRLVRPGRSPVEEWTRFVGQQPPETVVPQPPPPKPDNQTQTQIAELEKQVKQLRATAAAEAARRRQLEEVNRILRQRLP